MGKRKKGRKRKGRTKQKSKVRIYKTRPSSRLGWKATDPARDRSQALSFVRGGYMGSEARAVKTGKRGDIFPYTIFTRRKR